MPLFQRLGLAVIFIIGVTLTFLALRKGVFGEAPREESASAPMALSVPVEIIHDGEAPARREVEVRP